jgi:hypothetical protein
MSRIWRLAAPVAVAGGLIAAGVAPAAQARPAAYGITISATSPHYPGAVHGKVLGKFALVIYKPFKPVKPITSTAVISGNVTGASSGDTATLLAKPFGATKFAPTGTPAALSGAASQPYAFSVRPSLATAYEVQVSTGKTVDKTSAVQTVYVTAGEIPKRFHAKCGSGLRCILTYRLYVNLPSSAYKTEAAKHVYLYEALFFGKHPTTFSLTPSATASKAHKVNAGEFYNLITFHVKFRSPTQNWDPASCSKDTESRDGLGLPGHHGCGEKRFSAKTVYLG